MSLTIDGIMATQSESIFKNDLISLEYNDTRFGIYDSDGEYIDYLFYMEDEENFKSSESFYVNLFEKMNEIELVEFVKKTFNILKIEPECTSQDIEDLKVKWGDEYVCRIGNTAIIIRE